MFAYRTLSSLDDYFINLSARSPQGIYFYRINSFDSEVERFIPRYYEAARSCGVVLEGKIPNPDEKNLAYYEEIMGNGFRMSMGFITSSLGKWLPRMSAYQRDQVAASIYDTLDAMRREGKNENMQKNAYIKFMCWMYYRFERVIGQLGSDKVPKILYEGDISRYELNLLTILAGAGCDVVLLQYHGDQGYLKLDPDSRLSFPYRFRAPVPSVTSPVPPSVTSPVPSVTSPVPPSVTSPVPPPVTSPVPPPVTSPVPPVASPVSPPVASSVSPALNLRAAAAPQSQASPPSAFPAGYSLKSVRAEMEKRRERERLYGAGPQLAPCTNAWIAGIGWEDILKEPPLRGNDSRFFYNCFLRIRGVEDKLTYVSELYQMQLRLKGGGRPVTAVEEKISIPDPEEISRVRRKNYADAAQMLADLSANIQFPANPVLKQLMVKAFIDTVSEEEKQVSGLNKLTGMAVYLLCWLRRYQGELFKNWKPPDISCFLLLGGCRTEQEAMFLKLLSRLPVDVVILCPSAGDTCVLEDARLYEINYGDSLTVTHFPREDADVRMGTVAYHAERELDTLMYQDSGMYRNRQYDRAVSISLQTTYEELFILWDQELKYRPNFLVEQDVVSLPVIFAKISGVRDGQVTRYWEEIRKLKTADTFLVLQAPFIKSTDPNPIKAHAVGFYKNGRLQRQKIKEHPAYRYGFLREEMQDYILDKLNLLIEQKLIKGTFENGAEYTIISTVLNMNKDLIRMIQRFDFTGKNPKLIYIDTTEELLSLEDGILMAFLNLAGFDVALFVPTGYQDVEQYYNRPVLEEHQAGDYLYDLRVPDFSQPLPGARPSWREKIFKRG